MTIADVIGLGFRFVQQAQTRLGVLSEQNTLLTTAWLEDLTLKIQGLEALPSLAVRRAEGHTLTDERDVDLDEAATLLQALYRAAPRALGTHDAAHIFGQETYTRANGNAVGVLSALRLGAVQANNVKYKQKLLDAGFPVAKIDRLQALVGIADGSQTLAQTDQVESPQQTDAITEQVNVVWRLLRVIRDAAWDGYPVHSEERDSFRLYDQEPETHEFTIPAGERRARRFEGSLADTKRQLSLSVKVAEPGHVRLELLESAEAPFGSVPVTLEASKPYHPYRRTVHELNGAPDATWLAIENQSTQPAIVVATLLGTAAK